MEINFEEGQFYPAQVVIDFYRSVFEECKKYAKDELVDFIFWVINLAILIKMYSIILL